MRTAKIKRKTNETDIKLSLNLDGSGQYQIKTGIGFLDHLLSHVAVHGLFDLDLEAQGDFDIDPHHTMEDCALAIGSAFDLALEERKGIVRMASSYAPMDESLAFVAIDLSGRPYAVVNVEWHGPMVGDVPTSLITHFFESWSVTARSNLHARVFYGRDDHHRQRRITRSISSSAPAPARMFSIGRLRCAESEVRSARLSGSG